MRAEFLVSLHADELNRIYSFLEVFILDEEEIMIWSEQKHRSRMVVLVALSRASVNQGTNRNRLELVPTCAPLAR